jgi:arylsulfatase A-like enzyme
MEQMNQRNVIVFLCDQLRPDFLRIYGCEAIPTPNIDRLAARGIVFDRGITQATVCGPARATMMTGRYASDHGVWTNNVPFRDGLEYLPQRMNELGYATASFGKLHHVPFDDAKGFQHVRFMEENRLKERDDYLQWLKQRHPEVTGVFNRIGNKFKFSEDEYYEHWIASEAIDYLSATVKEGARPFFAWISFQGPHGPLDPPAEVKGSVDTGKLPRPISRVELDDVCPVHYYREVYDGTPTAEDVIMEMRTAYAEMIVEIDRQIGRVLDHVESLGVMEETTIVFSADHGDLMGDFGMNAKGPFVYHGQLAVPLVLANHPGIPLGARSDALAGIIDIPGTVLDIAGAERGIGMSRSLLELVREDCAYPREVQFSEHGDSVKIADNGRYRFGYYPFLGWMELYDREKDPREQHNLVKLPQYAGLVGEFLKHIVDFGILCKGVEIPLKDFVPEQQEGVRSKWPVFAEEVPAEALLSEQQKARLRAAGLSADYATIGRRGEK